MTVIKSLFDPEEQGYPHRIHRSKKNRRKNNEVKDSLRRKKFVFGNRKKGKIHLKFRK